MSFKLCLPLLLGVALAIGQGTRARVFSEPDGESARFPVVDSQDLALTLEAVRQQLLVGKRSDFEQAARTLEELSPKPMTADQRRTWVRLSRETAIRLGDLPWIEKLAHVSDPFDTDKIYGVLVASGQLEKGDLSTAAKTLDLLGNLEDINEREKRRVLAMRARIAQLEGRTTEERQQIEMMIEHLPDWPSAKCQSCHDIPSQPEIITALPIQRLWFGERFVELMKSQGDAESVKQVAVSVLEKNPSDDLAKIRLAFACQALGDQQRSDELFAELTWVQISGRPFHKPRMMTVFP